MEKQVLKACKDGNLFDFIANNYPMMSTYQLKEVILSLLGVVYDNRKGEEDYIEFQKQVAIELEEERGFGED